MRALHEAAQAGAPWQNGKAILSRAGSKSLRMADVLQVAEGLAASDPLRPAGRLPSESRLTDSHSARSPPPPPPPPPRGIGRGRVRDGGG